MDKLNQDQDFQDQFPQESLKKNDEKMISISNIQHFSAFQNATFSSRQRQNVSFSDAIAAGPNNDIQSFDVMLTRFSPVISSCG